MPITNQLYRTNVILPNANDMQDRLRGMGATISESFLVDLLQHAGQERKAVYIIVLLKKLSVKHNKIKIVDEKRNLILNALVPDANIAEKMMQEYEEIVDDWLSDWFDELKVFSRI